MAVAPWSPPPQRSRRRRSVALTDTTPARRKSARGKYYESPVLTGRAYLPPLSPYKLSGVVRIPYVGPSCAITNTDGNKYAERYDSDSEIGPSFDAVKNEINVDVNIEDSNEGLPMSMGGNGTDASPAASDYSGWFIADNDLMGMEANDLKEEIRRRGVVLKGKKDNLQNTLKEIVAKQMQIIEGGPDKKSESLGDFPLAQNEKCWNMA